MKPINVQIGNDDTCAWKKDSIVYFVGMEKHPSWAKSIKLPSCEAVSLFKDKTISCVHIGFDAPLEELCIWWPKIAPGGCISGRSIKESVLTSFENMVHCRHEELGNHWFIKKHSGGQQMEILPDCDIAIISGDCGASSWAYQLRVLASDRATLDRITPLIPKDTIVIDAGAFIGSHTSEYVKFSPEVWSFEPNPTAFSCLAYNCPTANVQNIALGDTEETMYCNQVYPNCGGSFLLTYSDPGSIPVKVKPLDSFAFKRRIGFIKIDVEGMEVRMLKGAERTICGHRPVMCIEVNTQALRRNNTNPEELFKLLESMDYNIEPMWPGQDDDYKKNFKDNPEAGFQWDIIATPKERKEINVVDEFHKKYYNSCVWVTDTKWRGVSVQKHPCDLWVYQEIINEVKPDLIIETGTCFGGGALFFADICDMMNKGLICSIDINERVRPEHKRIVYINGSSIDQDTISKIFKFHTQSLIIEKTLIFLDSGHSQEHVYKELELYSPLVQTGSYIIVEDTNVNGHPVCPDHGPGPMEAVELFLKTHPEFQIDKSREKFMMTQNPNGFLKRI